MRRAIDDEEMRRNSRVAGTILAQLRLRFDENWRVTVGRIVGAELNSMHRDIVLAVIAINGSRLLTNPSDPAGKDFGNPIPSKLSTHCNLSSISSATGIHRETVRRQVAYLKGLGILEDEKEAGLRMDPAFQAREEIRSLACQQIDAFAKAASDLHRLGMLTS